jgi:hypothetical protein
MVTLDLTITLGTIIETAVLGGGGIAVLVTLRNTVAGLNEKFLTSKQETDKQFAGIQSELKKMGDILIGMARFDEKLMNLDQRVTAQGRKIDELSRGQGFVRDHRSSIDGEYNP